MKNLTNGNSFKAIDKTSELYKKASIIYVNFDVNDVINVGNIFAEKIGKKSGKSRLVVFAEKNGSLVDVDVQSFFNANELTPEEVVNSSFKIIAKGTTTFEYEGKNLTLPTYKVEKIGTYQFNETFLKEIEKMLPKKK